MSENKSWRNGIFILLLFCIFIYIAFFSGVSKFKNDVIGKAVENACHENWICNEWGDCEEGYRARNCIDANNCFTELKKPGELEKCGASEVIKSGMSTRAAFEEKTGITLGGVFLFGALVLVLSSLAATLIAKEISIKELENEKKLENIQDLTLTRLANYIQREINCGYTKNQIIHKLTQEGWKRKSIDDAFSKINFIKKEPVSLEMKMDLSKRIEEEFKAYGR